MGRRPKSIAEALTAAAQLVEDETWGPPSSNQGWTISMAIDEVTGRLASRARRSAQELAVDAWTALFRHLDWDLNWESKPGRTQEEVVEAMRRVAQDAASLDTSLTEKG